MMYACCDIDVPHIVRAFVKDDGSVPPAGFRNVSVTDADVANAVITVGLEYLEGPGTFAAYVAPTPEGPWFYVQPSDLNTTSAVLVDVPNFAIQLFPNKRYLFDCELWWRSVVTTTGILFSVNGPASPVGIDVTVDTQLTLSSTNIQRITAYDGGIPTASIDTAAADRLCRVTGFIQTGAAGGPLKLRARSEVSGSQVTLRTGSRARVAVV